MNKIQCPTPVAILMATYNGEKYISEQIESVLNQKFDKWTLYIRDDGSTAVSYTHLTLPTSDLV